MQYYDEPTARPVKKIIAIILAVVLALAAIVGGVVWGSLEIRYNAAVELMNNSKYEQAITEFEALNGYKDSKELIVLCKNPTIELMYKNAIALLDNGKDAEAYALFKRLGNYKDTALYLKCFRLFYDSVIQNFDGLRVEHVYQKVTDDKGRLIRVNKQGTEGLELAFECKYDDAGRMVELASGINNSGDPGPYTIYTYDDEGRLIKSVSKPSGDTDRSSVGVSDSIECEYAYVDGLCVKESYCYRSVVSVHYFGDNNYEQENQYDAEGRLVRSIREYSNRTVTTEYYYDDGRLVKKTVHTPEYETRTNGYPSTTVTHEEVTESYDYVYTNDMLSSVTVTDTIGKTDYVKSYKYDENGNLTRLIKYYRSSQSDIKSYTEEFEYNVFNIVVSLKVTEIYKSGSALVYQTDYDDLGRKIYYDKVWSDKDTYHREWYQYDELGNLTSCRTEYNAYIMNKDGSLEDYKSHTKYLYSYTNQMETDKTMTKTTVRDSDKSNTTSNEYKGITVVFDRIAFEKKLQKRDDPANVGVGIQVSFVGPPVYVIPGI